MNVTFLKVFLNLQYTIMCMNYHILFFTDLLFLFNIIYLVNNVNFSW